MEVLGKLFCSLARVKIMRLFIFNPNSGFDIYEAARRSRLSGAAVKKEISFLKSINFIKQGKFYREKKEKKGREIIIKKVKVNGWFLNENFDYVESLRDLLVDSKFLEKNEVLKRFKNAGSIKLLFVSGIFIKNDNSPVDILIVGDKLKRNAIEHSLRQIESEMGKELKYAVLETPEFVYRLEMYDKFIRDILDYPHSRLIEKIKAE